MKTITLLAALILSSSMAQATGFLPQTTPPAEGPVLKCRNSMVEIPESRLSVQVYAATEQNPYGFVTIQKINTNGPDHTLFAGEVTEKVEGESTLLFAGGMNMKISDGKSGDLDATVTLKKGEDLKYFTMNCETIRHVMPIPTQM